MPVFKVTTLLNDGKAEAPPFEIEVPTAEAEDVVDLIWDELWEHNAIVIPVGGVMTVERIS